MDGSVNNAASSPLASGDASNTSAESQEITAIARGLDEWYTHLGRQYGPLSRPQRRMLRLLVTQERTRVSDLAERLGLTTAGSTRMLDTLEAQGYINRMRMPETDQREVYVTLTAPGHEALRLANLVYLRRVAEMVERLSPAERVELARLFHAAGGEAPAE